MMHPNALFGLLPLVAAGLLTVSPAAYAQDGVADGGMADVTPARTGHLPEPTMSPNVPDYSLNSQDFVFPSGLRIIMQADHSEPMVAITTVVDRGSTADPLGDEGIAHFVEHVWFKSRQLATDESEGPRTWDVLSEMGCNLNAATTADWTTYMTVCPNSAIKPLMRFASRRLTDTVIGLKPEEVESEREVIRNELRMRYENGGAAFLAYVFDRLYPEDHPYHRLTIGTHSSLDNITLEDIQTFTEVNYTPQNATIVIVGDFNPEEASSLIFENFAPEVLDPNLTSEDIVWYPREGVAYEDVDPENPSDDLVLWTAIDPNSTLEDPSPFRLSDPLPPRSDSFGIEPTLAFSTETGVFDAPVDARTVVVAWSVPGAYQGNDIIANVAAGMAGQQMAMGLMGDPRVATIMNGDEDTGFPNVGCGAVPGKENTTVICQMEITDSAPGERMAEMMIDQLPPMWDPERMQNPLLRTSYDNIFSLQKMDVMRDTLLSMDTVSGLMNARATTVAWNAHYTGSHRFHSDTMNAMSRFDVVQALQFAERWFKRDRAASAVLNPIPMDERVLDSSESDYHGASRESDVIVSALAPDNITPELIASEVAVPPLDQLNEITLENGLRVVIFPHGEAPLVEVQLVAFGGSDSDLLSTDSYATRFFDDARYDMLPNGRPVHDPLRIAADWVDYGGGTSQTKGIRASSGNLDGALYLLRTRLDESSVNLRGRGKWLKDARKALVSDWRRQGYWESRVVYDRLGQDAPAFHFRTWDNLDTLAAITPDELRSHVDNKFSPANATLVIVGNIDPDEAGRLAQTYFGAWADNTPDAERIAEPEMAPILETDPMVYVFDDPKKTQTEVELTCRLADSSMATDAARAVATQMVSDQLFETLRAEHGVTYGAYARQQHLAGDTGLFNMQSLVQNNAVALAVQTFAQSAEDAASGDYPMERFRPSELSQARKYVLNQQSVGQMTRRILSPIRAQDDWDRITGYPERLSHVDVDQMAALMAPCASTWTATATGPVEVIEPQLQEAGIPYEIFDYEAAGLALMDEHDPKAAKKYRKALAKKAEAEAEAEAEAAEEEGEDAPEADEPESSDD